jgi:hypothetical protein
MDYSAMVLPTKFSLTDYTGNCYIRIENAGRLGLAEVCKLKLLILCPCCGLFMKENILR